MADISDVRNILIAIIPNLFPLEYHVRIKTALENWWKKDQEKGECFFRAADILNVSMQYGINLLIESVRGVASQYWKKERKVSGVQAARRKYRVDRVFLSGSSSWKKVL